MRPFLVGILSALVILVWTAARIHYVFDGNWTALFSTGTRFRVPPDLEPGTYRFEGSGYDGQFYRYLAHDPFLNTNLAPYADKPRLRFRRLLVPLAAWSLALGQPALIDVAYLGVELLFLALGTYWSACVLSRRGRSALWGMLFVVVPATLASFDRMLVDGPLTALFAGFLLYCEEQRWWRVWILAMLAALTRDTGLFLCAALVIDQLLHCEWGKAAWFASSAAPAIAWYTYVAAHFRPDGPIPVLAFPAWGIVQRLLWVRPYPDPALQLLLRVTDFLAVVGLALSVVLAIRWIFARPVSPATICVGLFAALALVLGSPGHMLDAFGFARPVSPLLLWVMIEGVSRKKWVALAAPLCVSLSVSLVFAKPFAKILGSVGR